MWHKIDKINTLETGRIFAVWFSPDGSELLLITEGETQYRQVLEGRLLWTIPERAGGSGLSPDGQIYRDISSGLFYPLMSENGGKQRREHIKGGKIKVEAKTLSIVDRSGGVQRLPIERQPLDWQIASFCESGDYILIAGPRNLAVYSNKQGC